MPKKIKIGERTDAEGSTYEVFSDGSTRLIAYRDDEGNMHYRDETWLDDVEVIGERPKWWQQFDPEKSEQARQNWNQWMPQNYRDFSNPNLFRELGNTSSNSVTPKALQTSALDGNEPWQQQIYRTHPIQNYDGPDYNRDARIKAEEWGNFDFNSSQDYSSTNFKGRATDRHIQMYMSVIEESAKRMQELEKPILYAQQGIEWLSKLLAAGIIVDLGMFWNYFYWIPKLGSDIIEGSELDWMAEQIGLRSAELEEMLVEYNREFQKYEQGAQALKLALQSETITLEDGTTLKRTEDDDSTLIQMGTMGIAGLSIHKNRNNAKGTYLLYRIVIDGKVYKYGVADAGRRTAAGIPVRLAQQISKFERIFEATGISVNYRILVVEKTTKLLIKRIETEKILKHAEHSGIPIGNRAHIKKYIGLKIGKLSNRAMSIIIKFFKF